MNRRQFLTASGIALALGKSAIVSGSEQHTPYSREAYEQALASGKPFMLDFFAPW